MSDPPQTAQLENGTPIAENTAAQKTVTNSDHSCGASMVTPTTDILPKQAPVDILKNVSTSCNVEEQMDVVKKISCHLLLADKDSSVVLDFNYVHVAADLYLSSPLKHPIKCALSKTFNVIDHNAKELCIKYLQEGLKYHLHKAIENKNDITDLTVASSALLGCYENFRMGHNVLDGMALDIVVYLREALNLCYSFLSSDNTPMFKVAVSKAAHNISRIIITALQQIVANSLADTQIIKLNMSSILSSVIQFMNRPDVPLDTRTNFGFVLVLILDYLEGPQGWMQLLETKTCIPTTNQLSILCICSGLLSGLKSDQFVMLHSSSGKAVIACILDTALSVNELCIQESSVVLALWRVVQQLTRVLTLNPTMVSFLHKAHIENILKHLFGLLDHYTDSVRHLARAILENLMQIKETFTSLGIDLGDKMSEAVRLTPETKRSRYVILSTMTSYMSTSEILEKIPDVISYLLRAMQCTSMSSHVAGSFVAMSSADFKTLPYSQWYKRWVEPLFHVMLENNTIESPALEEALSKIVKMCPRVIKEVFFNVDENTNIELPRLRVLMTCVKLGRKQGVLVMNNDEKLWFGILPVSLLKSALCHECDEIRVAAVGLIVETNRSTELFSQVDFLLLKFFLEYNVNCEVPSFRQEALAFMSKLFTRMKDSAHTLKRPSKQMKQNGIDSSKILLYYKDFLLWVLPFCFCNIRIGSNYSRRIFTLKLLIMVLDILRSDSLFLNDDCLHAMWTDENALTLLGVILTDTFEENKAMATKILVLHPDCPLGLHNQGKRLQLFKNGCSLASSIHPADCISAAYLLELCCILSQKTADISRTLTEEIFDAVTILKTQLERELNVAQYDILHAASKGPMYGTLYCIRHLLKLITDFGTLGGQEKWVIMIKNLVGVCFKLDKIASSIVNSSSPEGHLPMDFNESTNSSVSVSTTAPVSHPKVTAQMVLLCSWRTVKEVSLLLGKLSDCCPILPDPLGLLCEEDILAIGVHLTTLLEETKHRGAFEQAYVGFTLLAARLWRHPRRNLQELPQIWLNELLDAIQRNERSSSKLCATRRSAGVPYLVQALVSAELQTVGSPKSLQITMSQLLACAADKNRHVECRTHALNILRALYRHAPLAEHIAPYISEGVMVAVSGFKCKSWAERNSATLLFSSLMTRVFGVRRSREELSSRNKLTGRVFFHRYPELYDFLLLELSQAVNTLNLGDVGELAILHPILLLIGRLYPSSLEGMDTPVQLCSFIPLVHQCASNSVLKTRVLAAKAIVPLITINLFVKYLNDLFEQLMSTSSGNLSHGIALQVFNLLANSAIMNGEQSSMIADHLDPWFSKLVLCLSQFSCNPVREIILQIIELVVGNWYKSVSPTLWKAVKDLLSEHILVHSRENISDQPVGHSVFEMRATRVFLQILISDQDMNLKLIIFKLLQHFNHEVVQETLVFLERLMRGHFLTVTEEMEIEDIVPDVLGGDKHWSERLPEKALSECSLIFHESKDLGQRLATIAMSNKGVQSRLAMQALVQINPSLWCSDIDLRQLLLWCTSPHEGTSCAALSCFSSVLKYLVSCNDNIPELCETGCKLVKLYCDDEKNVISRKTAVCFLSNHREALNRQYLFLSDETVCELWITGIKLACDDNSTVRLQAVLLSQVEMPSVPQRCLENLLDSFNSIMGSSPAYCLATLLVLAVGPLPDSSSFEADEERVFEKGDSNMFIEHEILTDLTLKYISIHVLNNVNLSSHHWGWVWSMIGGPDREEISSAHELFDAIRQHNSSGLLLADTDFLLPSPIVCSLRCLRKVEKVYFGVSKEIISEFPFVTEKMLTSA